MLKPLSLREYILVGLLLGAIVDKIICVLYP